MNRRPQQSNRKAEDINRKPYRINRQPQETGNQSEPSAFSSKHKKSIFQTIEIQKRTIGNQYKWYGRLQQSKGKH